MKKQFLSLSLLVASFNIGASLHAKPKFYDSARSCAGLGAVAVMAVNEGRALYKPVEVRTPATRVEQVARATTYASVPCAALFHRAGCDNAALVALLAGATASVARARLVNQRQAQSGDASPRPFHALVAGEGNPSVQPTVDAAAVAAAATAQGETTSAGAAAAQSGRATPPVSPTTAGARRSLIIFPMTDPFTDVRKDAATPEAAAPARSAPVGEMAAQSGDAALSELHVLFSADVEQGTDLAGGALMPD